MNIYLETFYWKGWNKKKFEKLISGGRGGRLLGTNEYLAVYQMK